MNTEINKNIFKSFPEFESERLLFRKFLLSDAKDILLIRSNDDVMRFMDVPRHNSISDSEKLIQLVEESYNKEDGINWAIIEKHSNSFVGYFGFFRIIPEHCRAEIGYALKPEYWGKGYMYETINRMVRFGFENMKLHSIEANVNPLNERSKKVLERIGFKKEAYFRENYLFDGKFLDSIIYSLLEKDLTETKGSPEMIDYKNHWDNVYAKSELSKLGWYEETPQPSLDLIRSCNLKKNAVILDVGSGATTLIKNLIQDSYTNIIATDISKVALDRAKKLLDTKETKKIRWIADDITNPKNILQLKSVDLWHDRTVLHFLIEENQRKGYLETLRKLVRKEGFVIIAVFSLEGAKKCSGLDVKNYDHKMIEEYLGKDFKLKKYFPYQYQMPSGNTRPYVYTLFQRSNKT